MHSFTNLSLNKIKYFREWINIKHIYTEKEKYFENKDGSFINQPTQPHMNCAVSSNFCVF